MEKFGGAYAEQVIRNSQALARALDDYGFPVVGSSLGYTESHQVLMNFGGYKRGREVAEKLEKSNVIADCGVRLGTSEVTRRGMKEGEMEKIAQLMKEVVIDEKESGKVRAEVEDLAEEFRKVNYCFQS